MGGVIVHNGLQQKFQLIWSLVVIVDDVSKLMEGRDLMSDRKI